MTKKEWEKVERALAGMIGHAELKVNGREVSLQRRLVSKNRLGIVVFVDGKLEGKWLGRENDHPEQCFYCPRDRYLYTAKSRAGQKKLIKKWGKRKAKEAGIGDPDAKIRVFYHYFPSVAAVRRHYQKTFGSIELVEASGC